MFLNNHRCPQLPQNKSQWPQVVDRTNTYFLECTQAFPEFGSTASWPCTIHTAGPIRPGTCPDCCFTLECFSLLPQNACSSCSSPSYWARYHSFVVMDSTCRARTCVLHTWTCQQQVHLTQNDPNAWRDVRLPGNGLRWGAVVRFHPMAGGDPYHPHLLPGRLC